MTIEKKSLISSLTTTKKALIATTPASPVIANKTANRLNPVIGNKKAQKLSPVIGNKQAHKLSPVIGNKQAHKVWQ